MTRFIELFKQCAATRLLSFLETNTNSLPYYEGTFSCFNQIEQDKLVYIFKKIVLWLFTIVVLPTYLFKQNNVFNFRSQNLTLANFLW